MGMPLEAAANGGAAIASAIITEGVGGAASAASGAVAGAGESGSALIARAGASVAEGPSVSPVVIGGGAGAETGAPTTLISREAGDVPGSSVISSARAEATAVTSDGTPATATSEVLISRADANAQAPEDSGAGSTLLIGRTDSADHGAAGAADEAPLIFVNDVIDPNGGRGKRAGGDAAAGDGAQDGTGTYRRGPGEAHTDTVAGAGETSAVRETINVADGNDHVAAQIGKVEGRDAGAGEAARDGLLGGPINVNYINEPGSRVGGQFGVVHGNVSVAMNAGEGASVSAIAVSTATDGTTAAATAEAGAAGGDHAGDPPSGNRAADGAPDRHGNTGGHDQHLTTTEGSGENLTSPDAGGQPSPDGAAGNASGDREQEGYGPLIDPPDISLLEHKYRNLNPADRERAIANDIRQARQDALRGMGYTHDPLDGTPLDNGNSGAGASTAAAPDGTADGQAVAGGDGAGGKEPPVGPGGADLPSDGDGEPVGPDGKPVNTDLDWVKKFGEGYLQAAAMGAYGGESGAGTATATAGATASGAATIEGNGAATTTIDPDAIAEAKAAAVNSDIPGLAELFNATDKALSNTATVTDGGTPAGPDAEAPAGRSPDGGSPTASPDGAAAGIGDSTTEGAGEAGAKDDGFEYQRPYKGDRDYYKDLEVPRKATPDQIQKAYRRLARENHPDANQGDLQKQARFKEISEAYNTLSDAKERKEYDESRTLRGRMRAEARGFAAWATGRTGDAWAPPFDAGAATGPAAGGSRPRPEAGSNPLAESLFSGQLREMHGDILRTDKGRPITVDASVFGLDPDTHRVEMQAYPNKRGQERTISLRIEQHSSTNKNMLTAPTENVWVNIEPTGEVRVSTSEGFSGLVGNEAFDEIREQLENPSSAAGQYGGAWRLVSRALGHDINMSGDGPRAGGTIYDTTPGGTSTNGSTGSNGASGMTPAQIAEAFRRLNAGPSGISGSDKYPSGRYRWYYDLEDQMRDLGPLRDGGPSEPFIRGSETREEEKVRVEDHRSEKERRREAINGYEEDWGHRREKILRAEGKRGHRPGIDEPAVIREKMFRRKGDPYGEDKDFRKGNAHRRYTKEQLDNAVPWKDRHKIMKQREKEERIARRIAEQMKKLEKSPYEQAQDKISELRAQRAALKEEIENLEKAKKMKGKGKRLRAARRKFRDASKQLRVYRRIRHAYNPVRSTAARGVELVQDAFDI